MVLSCWVVCFGFFFEALAAGIQGLQKNFSVSQRKSQTFLILLILKENWKKNLKLPEGLEPLRKMKGAPEALGLRSPLSPHPHGSWRKLAQGC